MQYIFLGLAAYLSLIIIKMAVCFNGFFFMIETMKKKEIIEQEVPTRNALFYLATGALISLTLKLPVVLWREGLQFFAPYSEEQLTEMITLHNPS